MQDTNGNRVLDFEREEDRDMMTADVDQVFTVAHDTSAEEIYQVVGHEVIAEQMAADPIAIRTVPHAALYLDVNGDGFLTPNDALVVIRDLNVRHAGDQNPDAQMQPTETGRRISDVNDDGFVTPLDALLLIGELRNNGSHPVANPDSPSATDIFAAVSRFGGQTEKTDLPEDPDHAVIASDALGVVMFQFQLTDTLHLGDDAIAKANELGLTIESIRNPDAAVNSTDVLRQIIDVVYEYALEQNNGVTREALYRAGNEILDMSRVDVGQDGITAGLITNQEAVTFFAVDQTEQDILNRISGDIGALTQFATEDSLAQILSAAVPLGSLQNQQVLGEVSRLFDVSDIEIERSNGYMRIITLAEHLASRVPDLTTADVLAAIGEDEIKVVQRTDVQKGLSAIVPEGAVMGADVFATLNALPMSNPDFPVDTGAFEIPGGFDQFVLQGPVVESFDAAVGNLPSTVLDPFRVPADQLVILTQDQLTAIFNAISDEISLRACNNGVDDNGNGLADFPDEPGCETPLDDDENGGPTIPDVEPSELITRDNALTILLAHPNVVPGSLGNILDQLQNPENGEADNRRLLDTRVVSILVLRGFGFTNTALGKSAAVAEAKALGIIPDSFGARDIMTLTQFNAAIEAADQLKETAITHTLVHVLIDGERVVYGNSRVDLQAADESLAGRPEVLRTGDFREILSDSIPDARPILGELTGSEILTIERVEQIILPVELLLAELNRLGVDAGDLINTQESAQFLETYNTARVTPDMTDFQGVLNTEQPESQQMFLTNLEAARQIISVYGPIDPQQLDLFIVPESDHPDVQDPAFVALVQAGVFPRDAEPDSLIPERTFQEYTVPVANLQGYARQIPGNAILYGEGLGVVSQHPLFVDHPDLALAFAPGHDGLDARLASYILTLAFGFADNGNDATLARAIEIGLLPAGTQENFVMTEHRMEELTTLAAALHITSQHSGEVTADSVTAIIANYGGNVDQIDTALLQNIETMGDIALVIVQSLNTPFFTDGLSPAEAAHVVNGFFLLEQEIDPDAPATIAGLIAPLQADFSLGGFHGRDVYGYSIETAQDVLERFAADQSTNTVDVSQLSAETQAELAKGTSNDQSTTQDQISARAFAEIAVAALGLEQDDGLPIPTAQNVVLHQDIVTLVDVEVYPAHVANNTGKLSDPLLRILEINARKASGRASLIGGVIPDPEPQPLITAAHVEAATGAEITVEEAVGYLDANVPGGDRAALQTILSYGPAFTGRDADVGTFAFVADSYFDIDRNQNGQVSGQQSNNAGYGDLESHGIISLDTDPSSPLTPAAFATYIRATLELKNIEEPMVVTPDPDGDVDEEASFEPIIVMAPESGVGIVGGLAMNIIGNHGGDTGNINSALIGLEMTVDSGLVLIEQAFPDVPNIQNVDRLIADYDNVGGTALSEATLREVLDDVVSGVLETL